MIYPVFALAGVLNEEVMSNESMTDCSQGSTGYRRDPWMTT